MKRLGLALAAGLAALWAGVSPAQAQANTDVCPTIRRLIQEARSDFSAILSGPETRQGYNMMSTPASLIAPTFSPPAAGRPGQCQITAWAVNGDPAQGWLRQYSCGNNNASLGSARIHFEMLNRSAAACFGRDGRLRDLTEEGNAENWDEEPLDNVQLERSWGLSIANARGVQQTWEFRVSIKESVVSGGPTHVGIALLRPR